MYVENEPAMERNEAVLNDFPIVLYTIQTNEKIPDNYKYNGYSIDNNSNSLESKVYKHRGLPKLLKLKIGEKVMLAVNIDIRDRLINDQTGNNRHIEFAEGSVCKIYVNFMVNQLA